MRELWRIVKDQIKEQTVAVVVLSKYSAIWRKTKLKSVMKEDQLKYVDAEGMRVITNSKHVAEQIKSDKDKYVAMDDQKLEKFGKIGRRQNLKSTVMDGVKFGKWVNSKIDKEQRKGRTVCSSIGSIRTERNHITDERFGLREKTRTGH